MFSAPLRYNLDPLNRATDGVVAHVLKRVHVCEAAVGFRDGLQHEIEQSQAAHMPSHVHRASRIRTIKLRTRARKPCSSSRAAADHDSIKQGRM